MTKDVEEYAESLNALGLSVDQDPFPIESPEKVNYWADNKVVLSKIIQAQIDSTMFATSSLYAFWGPIGVGKTFAANFLSSSTINDIISKKMKKVRPFNPKVFRVVAPYPKRTGDLTYGVHKEVVRKLLTEICQDEKLVQDLAQAYKDMEVGTVRAAFKDLGGKVVHTLFSTVSVMDIEKAEGFKFITGERSKIGKLTDINDLVVITRTLARVVLGKYTRIVLMIDELENLARATATERLFFSDYLRRLHDDIETGITWVMIFTFDSYEDVQSTLQPSLVSRIREVIAFDYVKNSSDVRDYVKECLESRTSGSYTKIMEQDVLTMVAQTLIETFKGRLSFRGINNEMHGIFARAYAVAGTPPKFKLDAKLYQKSMVVKPEDILREMKNE